jgi:transposase-like protein
VQEVQQKKEKRKQQQTILTVQELISEAGFNLIEYLQEQEADKKYLDVPVCLKCKSPKIKRVNGNQDALGHMALAQPKYECPDCGHTTSIQLKATNRPYSVKDVELILEAIDAADK